MKSKLILLSTLIASSLAANAQVTVDVNTQNPGVKVSPDLYGIFFEDINHAADGGLYAELIRNRSFEDNDEEAESWSTTGSASMKLTGKNLLNKVQGKALEVTFNGKGSLVNTGFWGINAVTGRKYRLSFFAKGKYKGTLKAQIISRDGTVLAETPLDVKLTGKWTKYTAQLQVEGNDNQAEFAIVGDGKGTVTLDVVSLFPPTFKNRANGLRPDLASKLVALHPKFVRFPGGCFVEGQQSPDNAFHWERTIGPIEERPGHWNVNWGYRTSDGMGFDEYLQLAEDLNAKPLFVVNVGLWHGGLTPVDSLQPWIDEALGALEYANGPVTSKYGALRAKNGHPAPYNIEYLEIGNENNQDDPSQQSDRYYERFKKFKDAILAKYPDIHLIGNVVAWGNDFPKWNNSEPVELLDEHYYRTPNWFADNFHKYDTYERGKHDIYVGEYAVTQGYGKIGNLNAALGEAVYMMGLENNSDVVKMASYAPLFANLNNTAWRPDLIQFTSDKNLGTPSYYVQQMMANNLGTRVLTVKENDPYTAKLLEAQVSPAKAKFGFGTWGTQASFQTSEPTKAAVGEWTVEGSTVSQKGYGEGLIDLVDKEVDTKDYTFKTRARKDGGNEGFLIVFNYLDENNYSWVNFGGWGNSQHAIEQVVDGAKLQSDFKPGRVETGRWYDVTVQQHGDSVKVWLDNELVFDTKLKQNKSFGVFSSATLDELTGDVIVKIANTGKQNTTAKINLDRKAGEATVIRLAANGHSENTIEHPTNVTPYEEALSPEDKSVEVEIPANSLNIVRIKK